jgi:flagellar biosynthesis protein FlhB
MSDQSQKTEQPTQKRKEKARDEGQYPSARQFLSGAQFCVFVAMVQNQGPKWLQTTAFEARTIMHGAFAAELDVSSLAGLILKAS